MHIPVTVKSINLTKDGAAEAVIEFNSIEFNASVNQDGLDGTFDINIDGVDIQNLERAGFILDLSVVRDAFKAKKQEFRLHKEEVTKKYREEIYATSRLHELEQILAPHFSFMPLEEFQESQSGALYAFYKVNYKNCCKEITIFMDKDKFIVYDQLNEKTITDFGTNPREVNEIIDTHIKSWKHKVDFKLALMAEVNKKVEEVPPEKISATEYFRQLQEKDKTHEDEIRQNHQKYLKMLGKLGDRKEIQDHTEKHSGIEETGSIEKKRLLGSLSDTKKIKIRHLFEDK